MKSNNLSLETSINELDFWNKAVIIRWNAWKKKQQPKTKNKKNNNSKKKHIPDPRNANEHYQS